MAEKSRIGVTGLAVMGANLARNMARRGFAVAVHNRTTAKTGEFMAEHGHEGDFTAAESLQEFVEALETPRKIVVMVKAGKPVDAVIDELAAQQQDEVGVQVGVLGHDVPPGSPSAAASRSRSRRVPRAARALTVPSGASRRSATSRSVSPSK